MDRTRAASLTAATALLGRGLALLNRGRGRPAVGLRVPDQRSPRLIVDACRSMAASDFGLLRVRGFDSSSSLSNEPETARPTSRVSAAVAAGVFPPGDRPFPGRDGLSFSDHADSGGSRLYRLQRRVRPSRPPCDSGGHGSRLPRRRRAHRSALPERARRRPHSPTWWASASVTTAAGRQPACRQIATTPLRCKALPARPLLGHAAAGLRGDHRGAQLPGRSEELHGQRSPSPGSPSATRSRSRRR